VLRRSSESAPAFRAITWGQFVTLLSRWFGDVTCP
jgi:hypothetical protein